MRSRSRTLLSPRQTVVAWVLLGIAALTLGVWILATGDPWIGFGFLLVGIVWTTLAFVAWRKPESVLRNREQR